MASQPAPWCPAGSARAGKPWCLVSEIKVLEDEFGGNFMNPGYRFPNQPVKPGDAVKPEDTHALDGLNVKSVISGPLDGANLRAGKVAVHGAAWAGEADIVKVEISADGGASWNPASLGREQARFAWRLWSYEWKANAETSRSSLAPATVRAACSLPRQSGIPAAICTTPWIR